MEDLVSGLKSQIGEQSAQLQKFSEILRELKDENESLRKVTEQIQLDVTKIKETIHSDKSNIEGLGLPRASELDICCCSITKEPPVQKTIRTLTVDDEREWVKARINELKVNHGISQNEGLIASEESIQKIFSNLQSRASSSCRITLTNYSTSTLMNPTYYVPTESERKIRLPSLIDGDKSEAICFEGSGEFCRFLCSFEIGTTLLRMIIFGGVGSGGSCVLGIGFSPANFSVNKSLYSVLGQNDLPADWVMSTSRETPIEVFSNQGNYFARGHMTPGPNSVVSFEILESEAQHRVPSVCTPIRKTSSTSDVTLDYFQRIFSLVGSSTEITLVIEVANYLIVPIKLRGCRSCESSRTLAEVPPLGMEIFFATGKCSIEAAIVYEIESTDLALVVVVKAGRCENKFAAVFIPVVRITLHDNLDKMLDQNQWNYLLRQAPVKLFLATFYLLPLHFK